MKENNSIQLVVEPNHKTSGNMIFPAKEKVTFYSQEPYGPGQPRRLKCRSNTIYGNYLVVENFKPETIVIPAKKTGTWSFENLTKKKYFSKIALRPFNKIYLKEAAARLSDIELAIDNDDANVFQVAIHALMSLFIDMKMPEASRLTGQMEELAAEYKLQDVRNQLLLIKKIIAQFA